jgi:hypothetical protein
VNQHSTAAILGVLLLAPTAPVAAQQPPDLPQALVRIEPSDTVTILDTDGRRLVGRVTQVSSSGLTLVQRGQATSVPLQRVTRITISDSNRNGTAMGALIGAAIGAAGGVAVNAICANEGGGFFSIVLALAGAGAASGAGIGWLGDRLHQSVVYAVPGAPREFASEMGVTFITDSRGGMTFPGVGGSWGMTSHAGLGFEMNVNRSVGGRDGEGRGTSFDGRVRYIFGKGRYRPYGLAGVGYFEYVGEAYSQLVPAMGSFPERRIEGRFRPQGVAPLVGGGVRVGVTPKISIRPEVIWYPQPGGGARSALRASVGVGFRW